MNGTRRALAAARIFTGHGVIAGGVVVVDGARVAWVGLRAAAPAGVPIEEFGERVITPGLIDAHTHAAWLGSRHDEYAMRLAGGGALAPGAIAAAGGGIVSTMRAIAAASEDDVFDALRARLVRMARLGVTCVEVKSGYGLEPEHELKQLRAIARAASCADLPRVVPTFLALHALPPSARDKRAEYIEHVARALVPRVAEEGLARFVDAYVDADAFTAAEARAVCEAARAAGLGVRLHVGQFADVGGAELCADVGARSADHLENVSDAGIARLASAGTSAVLLPVASFTLRQAPPPVAKLRAAGVALVVASDANPGTAPTESLPLAITLAAREYGLSPDEALVAATCNAARALDVDGGELVTGGPADLVVWDLPHEHAITQPWGTPKTHLVMRAGRAIA